MQEIKISAPVMWHIYFSEWIWMEYYAVDLLNLTLI